MYVDQIRVESDWSSCVQKRCSPEEAVDKTPVIDDRSGTRLGSSLRVDGKALKAERRD